jgi:hypothetical protein
MKYTFAINRKFSYVKTYRVVKRPDEQTNAISKLVQKLIDKYVLKSEKQ